MFYHTTWVAHAIAVALAPLCGPSVGWIWDQSVSPGGPDPHAAVWGL